MSQPTYQFSQTKLGSLDCGIVRPSDPNCKIEALAVFCHGFGAGGDDLVGLASELLQMAASDKGLMLVFPAAPLSLESEGMPGGRAWWLLSIQRLLTAIEVGQYEVVRDEVPEGIDEAREKLSETIGCALDICQLDASRLLLGGFSQGAMLAVDTALRGLNLPPAKLCLYSGLLICERLWKPTAARLKSTEIFQSHGTMDPILPLQTGLWLTELLRTSGCKVDFLKFSGGHTIPFQALERTAQMLTSLLESE